MRYLLIVLLFTSCTLFEESKVNYFSNQLTPTINASLTLFSSYLKCKQSVPTDTSSKSSGITFLVQGKKDHFFLTGIKSHSKNVSTCDQVATFSTREIPYLNKLTRWYNKEKEVFTYDIEHGKLYGFSQMYVNTTYQFEITFLSANEIEVFIKRTDAGYPRGTQEGQNQTASFYEQHHFRGNLKSTNPLQVYYVAPGNNTEFSW